MTDNNDANLQELTEQYLSEQPLEPLRCPHCGHLLHKQSILLGKIEEKCKNCKETNTFIYNDLDTLFEIIFDKNEKNT